MLQPFLFLLAGLSSLASWGLSLYLAVFQKNIFRTFPTTAKILLEALSVFQFFLGIVFVGASIQTM